MRVGLVPGSVREHLSIMRRGSVLVDVAIDHSDTE
jgi:alanine dehydrogenase